MLRRILMAPFQREDLRVGVVMVQRGRGRMLIEMDLIGWLMVLMLFVAILA